MTEKFWQQHKARIDETPDRKNKLLKQTYEDAASIASRKHPKYLYVECLRNGAEWRSYSAAESFGVADMAMYACKNVGCAVNYCSLVKMGWPSDWTGSSDCIDEQKNFNKCMVDEQRRFQAIDKKERPPIYEYVQARILEKVEEDKYIGLILNETENNELKEAIRKQNQKKEAALTQTMQQ